MIANSRTKADARAASGASAGYLTAVPAPSTASGAGADAGGTAHSSPPAARRLAGRTPSFETVRTWDGEQPWLGHGPPILSATVRDVLAVLDHVSDLCGPQGNPRALAIVDFPSAEAALTAASQRVTQALS